MRFKKYLLYLLNNNPPKNILCKSIVKQIHLALECGYELAILWEDREVEVVVVVRNGDLPGTVDANADRVVCDPWRVCSKLGKRIESALFKFSSTFVSLLSAIFCLYLRRQSAEGNCPRSRRPWRSGRGCHWWRSPAGRWRPPRWGTRGAWSSQTCSTHFPTGRKWWPASPVKIRWK